MRTQPRARAARRATLGAGIALAAVIGAAGVGAMGASAGPGVSVSVSPELPAAGAKITVTLVNGRSARILVPGGRDWCSFFTVERLAAGRWRPVRACPSAPRHLYAVDAGRRQDGVLALAGGPLVGRSGPPGVLAADLRTLPVTPLPKPGERPLPAQEVPLGILPGGQVVRAALPPARYRATVRYWTGSRGARCASAARGPSPSSTERAQSARCRYVRGAHSGSRSVPTPSAIRLM